jgi:hypothetical protein
VQPALLAVEVPPLLVEHVGHGSDVERRRIGRGDLEHRQVGPVGDHQLGLLVDGGEERPGAVAHLLRLAHVALVAEVPQGGPRAGDGRGRPRPRGGGRPVQAPGPAVEEEPLVPERGRVAVEDDRRALEGVPVLVQVGRQRGDAFDAEVPGRDRFADAGPEGEQPTAEAGVDVHREIAFERDRGEGLDGVDDPERVAGRGADDEDRAVIDGGRARAGVGAAVGAHRGAPVLDAQVLAGLGERGVHGLGGDDVGRRHPAVVALAAGRVHREEDRFGAAAGHRAGEGIAPEEPGRHGHDLALHLDEARVLERVERVLVQVAGGDLVEHGVEAFVVSVVDEAERPSPPPVEIGLPGGVDLREQLVGRRPVSGQVGASFGSGIGHGRRAYDENATGFAPAPGRTPMGPARPPVDEGRST